MTRDGSTDAAGTDATIVRDAELRALERATCQATVAAAEVFTVAEQLVLGLFF